MKLSKQRMVAVGVLGLAAMALATDRLLLSSSVSGPSAASASLPAPQPADAAQVDSAQAAVDGAGAAASPKTQLESVASRLQKVDAANAQPRSAVAVDASESFTIPATWLPQAHVEPATSSKPEPQIPSAVTDFKASITAIFGTSSDPMVQLSLDGGRRETVKLGQSIGGLTLLRVDLKTRTAFFGFDGHERALTLGTSNER